MHPNLLDSFWPGFQPGTCTTPDDHSFVIHLEPRPEATPLCGRCHQPSPLVHDRRIRTVRDRDLFDKRVHLRIPVRRVDCLNCGRMTELIDWLKPGTRLTRRMGAWIEALLPLLPISHISQLTGLHWHTIKTLDKRRLEASVGTFAPGDV